jgi:hypothetical protein
MITKVQLLFERLVYSKQLTLDNRYLASSFDKAVLVHLRGLEIERDKKDRNLPLECGR